MKAASGPYMGTPFIAHVESAATSHWKKAVALASIDDIELTSAVTGLATYMIRFADWAAPARCRTGDFAMSALDADSHPLDPNGWGPFSAGHRAAGVDAIVPVEELVARIEHEVMTTLSAYPKLRISKCDKGFRGQESAHRSPHVYPAGLMTVSDVQLLEGMADFARSVPEGPGDDRNMMKLLAGWRHAAASQGEASLQLFLHRRGFPLPLSKHILSNSRKVIELLDATLS
jgi:hypothetical protein